jgi:hypothetical protein
MSAIEEDCRWSIIQAWCVWAWWAHRPLGMLAYARALGVAPTDPPSEDW